MQFDESANRLDGVIVEPQFTKPFACHAGTHKIVVVKGDPAVFEPPGGGFTNVMQKRGNTQHYIRFGHFGCASCGFQFDRLVQHGQAVLVHIFVTIVIVLGFLQHGQFR